MFKLVNQLIKSIARNALAMGRTEQEIRAFNNDYWTNVYLQEIRS